MPTKKKLIEGLPLRELNELIRKYKLKREYTNVFGTWKAKEKEDLIRAILEQSPKIPKEELLRMSGLTPKSMPITEREITRRRVTAEIDDKKILGEIQSINFIHSRREKGYETQLYQYLSARGYRVRHESQGRGARFDLVLGEDNVAVELKVVKNASVFDPLVGQIQRYKGQFRKVIVVLIDEWRNPSIISEQKARIEGLDPQNIKVILK